GVGEKLPRQALVTSGGCGEVPHGSHVCRVGRYCERRRRADGVDPIGGALGHAQAPPVASPTERWGGKILSNPGIHTPLWPAPSPKPSATSPPRSLARFSPATRTPRPLESMKLTL